MTCTWPCMITEMPMRVGNLNPFVNFDDVVETSDRSYALDDIGAFLEDLRRTVPDRELGAKLWPSVLELAAQMRAPAVPTKLIYNDGYDTPRKLSYGICGDDLGKRPKVLKY